MPKTRAKKKDEVEQLVNKVKTSQSVIIAKLEGLKVNDAQELRKNLRKEDAQIVVVKKTLLKKSLEELKYELPDLTRLEGIIGIAFAQDEVTAAKILKDFSKTHPQVELSSGYLDGKVLDQVSVAELAALPSRDELIAKTIYTIKAPITGFVNVLAGNLRGLVSALKAISENKAN